MDQRRRRGWTVKRVPPLDSDPQAEASPDGQVSIHTCPVLSPCARTFTTTQADKCSRHNKQAAQTCSRLRYL